MQEVVSALRKREGTNRRAFKANIGLNTVSIPETGNFLPSKNTVETLLLYTRSKEEVDHIWMVHSIQKAQKHNLIDGVINSMNLDTFSERVVDETSYELKKFGIRVPERVKRILRKKVRTIAGSVIKGE